MDYAVPDKRKSRNDKRAKGRFNRFKRGGHFRTSNIANPSDNKGN